MPNTLTYEEHGILLEEYDWVYPYIQAMTKFCTVIDPATGKEVPITYPAERAFADKTTKVKIGGIDTKRETLPLPYMSLVLLDYVFDEARAQSAPYEKVQYSSDNKQVYSVNYPEPYNFIFQLDIRCKTNLEWFRIFREFHSNRIRHNAALIYAVVGLFGNNSHYTRFEGPTDNSEYDVGDNKDRIIRKTYTITLEGWLLHKPYKTPTVRYTTIEIQDTKTNDVLESFTIDGHKFEDKDSQ